MDRLLGVERYPDALGVRLLAAGRADLAPGGWSWRRLQKPFWTFYLNDRPGASVTVDGGEVALAPGRGYLIPAWTPFRTACAGQVRHLYLYLELGGLAEPPLVAGAPAVLELPADAELGWLAAVADQPGRRLGCGEQARLLALVLAAVAPWLPAGPPPAVPDPRLAPALALMEAHPERPFTVAALARRCRLGDDAFTRRFRAAFATTPVQHLRRLRARRAATLLRSTDWSTARIAAACGFGNRTYLARVFRETYAQSPATYRQARWDDAFPLGSARQGRWHHQGFAFER
jgi:AraC-like DNA-binding protein